MTPDAHTVDTAGGLTIEHAPANQRFDRTTPGFNSRDPIDTMPTGTFTSSNVHSGIYDFGIQELGMRYLRDGTDAVYIYTGVPAQVWQGLVEASSKGSFINANVATSYPYFKSGRDDLPNRSAMDSDVLRRFYYDP